jgi:hypothetical protein
MDDDPRPLLSRVAEQRRQHVAAARDSGVDELKARSDLVSLHGWSGGNADVSARIPSLLHTVNRLARSDKAPVELVVEYTEAVFGAIADLGAGPDESVIESAAREVSAAIDRFESEGRSASVLLLAYQRFLSYRRIRSGERERAIRAAIASAADSNAAYRATYVLCWYLVECSYYRKALRECSRARRTAQAQGSERWDAAFQAVEGIVHYSRFSSPDRAHRVLSDAVVRFNDLPRVRETDLVYAEALHYLGRSELDRGFTRMGLEYFIRAQDIKLKYQFGNLGTTYFHIRMAEALLGAKSWTQSEDHLREAKSFLNRIGNTSAAQVLYDHAYGNFLYATGQKDSATTLLSRAASEAKKHRYSRGELLLLSRLFVIHISDRSFGAALKILWRAVPAVFAGELRLNRGLMIRPGRYINYIRRPYRGPKTAATGPTVCPCEVHSQ